MTNDLVTWLLAQLDTEQALAERIKERFTARGERTKNPGRPYWPTQRVAHAMRDYQDPDLDAQGYLIEAFNPDRVIAEAETKRLIIKRHYRRRSPDWDQPGVVGFDCAQCGTEYPCPTLAMIALPYASRLGYQKAWRP